MSTLYSTTSCDVCECSLAIFTTTCSETAKHPQVVVYFILDRIENQFRKCVIDIDVFQRQLLVEYKFYGEDFSRSKVYYICFICFQECSVYIRGHVLRLSCDSDSDSLIQVCHTYCSYRANNLTCFVLKVMHRCDNVIVHRPLGSEFTVLKSEKRFIFNFTSSFSEIPLLIQLTIHKVDVTFIFGCLESFNFEMWLLLSCMFSPSELIISFVFVAGSCRGAPFTLQ